MIESLISLLAFIGFGVGDAGDPNYLAKSDENNPEMIRAIDSLELRGYDQLEIHEADEWFV